MEMAAAHGVHVSEAIESQHATENTKLHALYAYYFIGLKQNQIALLYRKAPSTIGRWIERYERTGAVSRKATESQRKYTPEHREWIRDYFLANPLSFLDEAKLAFEINWKNDISLSTIWRILREYGFTRKVRLEQEWVISFGLLLNSSLSVEPSRSRKQTSSDSSRNSTLSTGPTPACAFLTSSASTTGTCYVARVMRLRSVDEFPNVIRIQDPNMRYAGPGTALQRRIRQKAA